MRRHRGPDWAALALCLAALGPGSAAGQTEEDVAAAVAALRDPLPLYALSCAGGAAETACDSPEACEARLGTLRLLARAMDSSIPALISNASRQMTSEYGRSATHAACFDALLGGEMPGLLPGARVLASLDDPALSAALGSAEAFAEAAPGCPTQAAEAPTVGRYTAAELARQVTYPLEAIGANAAATCLDGAAGHVTQRPQVTFHLTEPDGHAIEFQIIYAPCDTVLVAATADGAWITSDAGAPRPSLRLSGAQIDGRVDLWIGTREAGARCQARFRARKAAN